MKNKFFILSSILSNKKHLHLIYEKFFSAKYFFLILPFVFFNLTASGQDTDYEVIDKEDEIDIVCWPAKLTARTFATTDRMETDTVIIPSFGASAGGLAPVRRLFNAVLVPNTFPNPDTAEIFDLLGNPLIINGTTIMFDTSAEAANRAQSILGGGGPTSSFHWVGYKSNFFQPDNVATYYYNIFHRWYGGMPCHHQSFGGRQWNGDNTVYANYSDTTFVGHPEFVSVLSPVSCFGSSDGAIKINKNPANPHIITVNGTTAASSTISGLSAGTYQISYTDSFGNQCDTIIILTQPASTGSSASVTNCGPYVWPTSGTVFTSSGTYTYTVLNGTCVQRDTLHLTLTTSTTNQVNTTAYNFYTWPVNGQTYTSSGTYFSPSSTPGCFTNNILNLNIINSPFNMNLVIDQEISCFGNNDGSIQATALPPSPNYTYILNGGAQMNNTGFFPGLPPGTHTVCAMHSGFAVNVCKTITLTEPPELVVTLITDSLVSCLGNDGGISASITGGTTIVQPYQTYWTNSLGIILNPLNTTDTFITGLTPGMYHLTVEDDHGCVKSASKILPLSVPLQVSATAAPIKCYNGTTQIIPSSTGGIPPITYSMFGFPLQTSYQAGTYTITATDAQGCTATTMIDFGDPAPLSSVNAATACNSYYWSMNGATYTASGNYVAVLTTLSGCFIVNLLQLTIQNNTTATASATACNSYTWTANNITYTTSGTYTHTVLNPSGCVHTSILNLTVNNNTTDNKTATACNSYTWSAAGANNPYTASGVYTATSINGQGCLHTATLNLTIYPNTSSSNSVTSCNSYTWSANGVTYTASGTYTTTGINAQGCTHTAILNLTIYQNTSGSTSVTSCNSYTWVASGLTYTSSGTYTATGINAQGCTHVATLNLTIFTNTSGSSNVTSCNSYTWTANGLTYTASGTYTATGLNAQGCIHTQTLILTIKQSTTSTQSATACNAYNWNIAGANNPYTASGTYTITSLNAQGCTHTQILVLTIKQSTSSTASVTAANSYTWNANGITYTNSGTYAATLLNAAGCDSLLTLHLTINQVNSILNLRCYIEGYMESATNMKPVLQNQMQPSLITTCDTILVELRSTTTPYPVLHQTKSILQRNGFATCSFPLLNANFYVVVKHRNAIQTWSSVPVFLGTSPAIYNFTTAINKAYGSNQTLVSPGVWAFYSGDIDQEENIDLLDLGLLEDGISNFDSGYQAADINGDGSVDLLDSQTLEENLNDFIYSKHP